MCRSRSSESTKLPGTVSRVSHAMRAESASGSAARSAPSACRGSENVDLKRESWTVGGMVRGPPRCAACAWQCRSEAKRRATNSRGIGRLVASGTSGGCPAPLFNRKSSRPRASPRKRSRSAAQVNLLAELATVSTRCSRPARAALGEAVLPDREPGASRRPISTAASTREPSATVVRHARPPGSPLSPNRRPVEAPRCPSRPENRLPEAPGSSVRHTSGDETLPGAPRRLPSRDPGLSARRRGPAQSVGPSGAGVGSSTGAFGAFARFFPA